METNNNINRELLSKTFTTLETMYPGVLEPYRQKSEKIATMLRERFDLPPQNAAAFFEKYRGLLEETQFGIQI